VDMNDSHDPTLPQTMAEHLRLQALRSAAKARIDALRDALAGARRRNTELVAEIDRLVQQQTEKPPESEAWSDRVAAWADKMDAKRPGDSSNLVTRQVARATRIAWWTATLQLPRRVRMWRNAAAQRDAPGTPIRPSEYFRNLD